MLNDDAKINHPVLKLATMGGAWVAGMTWGERASMVAFFYTLLLITDWFWKRIGKPFALRRGWIKGKPRDFMDSTGSASL